MIMGICTNWPHGDTPFTVPDGEWFDHVRTCDPTRWAAIATDRLISDPDTIAAELRASALRLDELQCRGLMTDAAIAHAIAVMRIASASLRTAPALKSWTDRGFSL
jgi:hypothetical protein